MAIGQTTIGTAVSGPLVAFLVEAVMKCTPKGFDRKRFALPLAVLVSLAMSIIEALTYSHLCLWLAIVRGLTVAMASVGTYEIYNNYNPKAVNTDAK